MPRRWLSRGSRRSPSAPPRGWRSARPMSAGPSATPASARAAPAQAKKAFQAIAERADQGLEIGEADVRVAIGHARSGQAGPGALPVGRRGQVAPKTATQAEYLQALANDDLVFGLGPAGTGKTFLPVAPGAG